jgi:hypothetical protein
MLVTHFGYMAGFLHAGLQLLKVKFKTSGSAGRTLGYDNPRAPFQSSWERDILKDVVVEEPTDASEVLPHLNACGQGGAK